MKLTQKDKVENELIFEGEISRNWCLQNHISRLSAIILELKKEGWKFKEGYRKTAYGQDYVYKLISFPRVYENNT